MTVSVESAGSVVNTNSVVRHRPVVRLQMRQAMMIMSGRLIYHQCCIPELLVKQIDGMTQSNEAVHQTALVAAAGCCNADGSGRQLLRVSNEQQPPEVLVILQACNQAGFVKVAARYRDCSQDLHSLTDESRRKPSSHYAAEKADVLCTPDPGPAYARQPV